MEFIDDVPLSEGRLGSNASRRLAFRSRWHGRSRRIQGISFFRL